MHYSDTKAKQTVSREMGRQHGRPCKTSSIASPRKLGVRCGSSSTQEENEIGDDPTDFIATMDDFRFRLKDMGEEISEEPYTHLLLDSLTPEFQFVKDKSYLPGDALTTSCSRGLLQTT